MYLWFMHFQFVTHSLSHVCTFTFWRITQEYSFAPTNSLSVLLSSLIIIKKKKSSGVSHVKDIFTFITFKNRIEKIFHFRLTLDQGVQYMLKLDPNPILLKDRIF